MRELASDPERLALRIVEARDLERVRHEYENTTDPTKIPPSPMLTLLEQFIAEERGID
jgi:hypothetical protein